MLIDVTEKYSERMLGDVVHRLWDVKQTGLAGDAIGLKIGWSKAAQCTAISASTVVCDLAGDVNCRAGPCQ